MDLIKRNVELNKSYQRYPKNILVHEMDFLAETFSVKLEEELKTIDIAVAADGEFKLLIIMMNLIKTHVGEATTLNLILFFLS